MSISVKPRSTQVSQTNETKETPKVNPVQKAFQQVTESIRETITKERTPASAETVEAKRTVAANDPTAAQVQQQALANAPWNTAATKGLPEDCPWLKEANFTPETQADKDSVGRLQDQMNLLPGDQRGTIGPTTRAFVERAYEQKNQGDPRLEDLAQGNRTIGLGSTGDSVKALQLMMGAGQGGQTGVCGPQTTNSISEVQKKHNLDASGEVDAKTYEAIVKDYQARKKLTETGKLDEATLKALEQDGWKPAGATTTETTSSGPEKPLEEYGQFLKDRGINVDLASQETQGKQSITQMLDAVADGTQKGELPGTSLDFIKSLTDPQSGINIKLQDEVEDNAYVPVVGRLGSIQAQAIKNSDGVRAGEALSLAYQLMGQFNVTDPQFAQCMAAYMNGLLNGQ